MKFYILLDDEAPQDVADTLMKAITDWLKEAEFPAEAIDVREGDVDSWQLGIALQTKRKIGLKQPLEFLYKLAQTMEREFVIGIYDEETGNREDVCYFGCEEGRPDLDEVALYLGLNH